MLSLHTMKSWAKPGRAEKLSTGRWNGRRLVQCGEMVGRGQKILEMVIDYAKNRVQFGRPIGAFQAIQHQLADLRVAVDAAELLTYRAACSMAEGHACAEEIALAKASADEMSRLSTVVGPRSLRRNILHRGTRHAALQRPQQAGRGRRRRDAGPD